MIIHTGISDLIANHNINVIVGAICTSINIPLLFVFFSFSPFRHKYQILIALALADCTNCLAIMTMGINRVQLYTRVAETSSVPVRTAWDCALEPWLWLRGIGDLWPPIIQVTMGIERYVAVFYPIFFKLRFKKRSYWTIGSSVTFVMLSLVTGFMIAWSRREEKVNFYCGRKAAFTQEYGIFIYFTNIAGYTTGAALNFSAFMKAKSNQVTTGRTRSTERFRYYLLISFVSTVLVCIPNFLSLMSVLFGKVSDDFARPAVWLTCVNSGANFFIYMTLNTEYRKRVFSLLCPSQCGGESERALCPRRAARENSFDKMRFSSVTGV